MKANPNFSNLNSDFWGYIRFLGDRLGYSDRKTKSIKIYSKEEILNCLNEYNLKISDAMLDKIIEYALYRRKVLNTFVKDHLMDKTKAESNFEQYKLNFLKKYSVITSPQPMNKQKGDKRKKAFFTCAINLITENAINTYNKSHNTNVTCDYDPHHLTIIEKDDHSGYLKETLSRRFDGAIPALNSPISLWEIKEYYYTTSFGSRIADGVYETLLDGHEIKQIQGKKPIHNFLIDGYFTWWVQGRSYLCRIIDALNMGYVNEVVFGSEIYDIWYDRILDFCYQYTSQNK